MPICSHCGLQTKGTPAGVHTGRIIYSLCHPMIGLDCFELVTAHGHLLRECWCGTDGTAPLTRATRPKGSMMSAQSLDHHAPAVAAMHDAELRGLVAAMLKDDTAAQPWRDPKGEEKCADCRRDNPCWWVPDAVWNEVMLVDPQAALCPACFIRRAERAGIGRRGAWQLYPANGLF